MTPQDRRYRMLSVGPVREMRGGTEGLWLGAGERERNHLAPAPNDFNRLTLFLLYKTTVVASAYLIGRIAFGLWQ